MKKEQFIPGFNDFVVYITRLVRKYGVEIDLQAWHEIQKVIHQATIVAKKDKLIKIDASDANMRDYYAALDKLGELLGVLDFKRCEVCWNVLDENGVCSFCSKLKKERDDDTTRTV